MSAVAEPLGISRPRAPTAAQAQVALDADTDPRPRSLRRVVARAGGHRSGRPHVERHVRSRRAARGAHRSGRARRSLRGARGHREHRSRRHDDHGHLVRRVGGLAVGPVGGCRHRDPGRHARRAAARARHGHVRRRSRGVGRRDQHPRSRRHALSRDIGVHRPGGCVGHALTADQWRRRRVHLSLPVGRAAVRLGHA